MEENTGNEYELVQKMKNKIYYLWLCRAVHAVLSSSKIVNRTENDREGRGVTVGDPQYESSM